MNATPVKDGYYANPIGDTVYAESDNTQVGFYQQSGAESVLYNALPAALKQHTAIIPNTAEVLTALPIDPDTKYRLAIVDNADFIDNDGSYTVPGSTLQSIENLLAKGGGVFYSSPYALMLQNDNTNFASYYAHVHTDAADTFYGDTLGISYLASLQKYNSSTGAYTSFTISPTSDPIGAGLPTAGMPASGCTWVGAFTVDAAKSTPLFFFDKTAAKTAGLRYTSPWSNGKMVFLGFSLSTITTQKYADSIARHSIAWLLGTNASVETPELSAQSLSASANPFHNATEITYTAAAGEHNVSFAAYDVLGREVAKLTPRVVGENTYSVTFDASTLAEGAYTILAHSSTGAKQVRVVSEH